MKKLLFCGVMSSFMLFAAGCDRSRVYEEYEDLEGNVWPVAKVPSFTFEITDVNQPYDLFVDLRHVISYPYYNLYLRHVLLGPDGKKINSALHNLYLSDPKTGEPKGSGAGDIFDHQIRFLRNVKFTRPGRYTIRFQQYMRHDPLPDVMAVGLRVAKAEPAP